MHEFVASGRVVDLVLALIAVEACVILGLKATAGTRMSLLAGLLPGVCLLGALRVALSGGRWEWLAVWLACAGLTHAGDLYLTLRARRQSDEGDLPLRAGARRGL